MTIYETPTSAKELYSAEEIRAILGISRTSLYTLLQQGIIKSVKIGKKYKIKRSDFDEYIDSLDS